MSALMPLYIKKIYQKDPHFADTKVILSLYDNGSDQILDERFADKLKFDGFGKEIISELTVPSYENILRIAIQHSDGVTVGSEVLDEISQKLYDEAVCLKQEFVDEENQTKAMSEFFDKVIEEEVLI